MGSARGPSPKGVRRHRWYVTGPSRINFLAHPLLPYAASMSSDEEPRGNADHRVDRPSNGGQAALWTEPAPMAPARHVPAFFLSEAPRTGPVQLAEGEAEHGLKVLRMRPGQAALGLDGLGGKWPLVVEAAQRRRLDLVVTGPREEEPLPGEPGAPLPWIEVAVAWPKKQRGEEMLGRLVQLGVSQITPLVTRRGHPPIKDDAIPARWQRILREHSKQCGRLWLPAIREPLGAGELAGRLGDAAAALLDPVAGFGLDSWVRSLPLGPSLLGTRARPIVLIIGPEGGFDSEEQGTLLTAGACPVRLGPHVLRIETAAEAALAVTAAHLG